MRTIPSPAVNKPFKPPARVGAPSPVATTRAVPTVTKKAPAKEATTTKPNTTKLTPKTIKAKKGIEEHSEEESEDFKTEAEDEDAEVSDERKAESESEKESEEQPEPKKESSEDGDAMTTAAGTKSSNEEDNTKKTEETPPVKPPAKKATKKQLHNIVAKPPAPPKSTTSTSGTTKPGEQLSEDDPKSWSYFTVMFAKAGNKKHKTYDDGVLVVKPRKYILKDAEGKTVIDRVVGATLKDLKEGETIEIGNKELEIMKRCTEEEYSSGRIFLQYQNLGKTATSAPAVTKKVANTKFKKHEHVDAASAPQTDVLTKVLTQIPEGAFVLNEGHPPKDEKGAPIHTVYVDPFLAKNLRPHQKEGIKFMYECVMGMRSYSGFGCLLADEMGLGKTLQSIALLYTLLKRGPQGKPVVKKAIIVTPSSLVSNWAKEIKKWLTAERLTPLVCSAKGKQKASDIINDFRSGYHKVLIISYDLCRNNEEDLKNCNCDLIICDEAHRLKNKEIKTVQVLNRLGTRRRIMLTGTPLQNNLEEFFNIVEFINPGLLGSLQGFKNLFADPISKSREPNATAYEKKIGAERSEELAKLTSEFLLRRTSDVISKHLPPKVEFIVFCRMSELQTNLYRHFLRSKVVNSMLSSSLSDTNMALSCINGLKKLLTHPNMIYKKLVNIEGADGEKELDQAWAGCSHLFPDDYDHKTYTPEFSGKLRILDELLKTIRPVGDKIVIVSNYTSTLDEIELLCNVYQYPFLRLDGTTPSDKRLAYVDNFNADNSKYFCFLLSSKAGGVGLNLIGANRILLFDPDWNPSNDLQAMARVWRDGQKKKVFIYRLMSTGTIEEKIFQRQIVKEGLSKTVMSQKSLGAAFSKDELRALFKLRDDVRCETYLAEAENMDETAMWDAVKVEDDALYRTVVEGGLNSEDAGIVSFVKIRKEGKDAIFDDPAVTEDGAEAEEDLEQTDEKDCSEEEEAEYQFADEKPKAPAEEPKGQKQPPNEQVDKKSTVADSMEVANSVPEDELVAVAPNKKQTTNAPTQPSPAPIVSLRQPTVLELKEVADKLSKATADKDSPAIRSALATLKQFTVTKELLAATYAGKVVNALRNYPEADIVAESQAIVSEWRQSVRQEKQQQENKTATTTSNSSATPAQATPTPSQQQHQQQPSQPNVRPTDQPTPMDEEATTAPPSTNKKKAATKKPKQSTVAEQEEEVVEAPAPPAMKATTKKRKSEATEAEAEATEKPKKAARRKKKVDIEDAAAVVDGDGDADAVGSTKKQSTPRNVAARKKKKVVVDDDDDDEVIVVD